MIQDIYPHTFHNEYAPCPPKDDDIVFVFCKDVLCMKEEEIFYSAKDWHDSELIWLFRIDDTNYFACDVTEPCGIRVTLWQIRSLSEKHLRFAAACAWQLHAWMKENRYCGVCGNVRRLYAKERALECPACGNILYPRINPAVIAGAIHDDALLVTRLAGSRLNSYALVAGFNEIGETIEETVKREIMEEVGLEVTDVTFYKSQPWPFSSTLLLGFYCHVTDADVHEDHLEIDSTRWLKRGDDYSRFDDISLTSEMIENFMKGNIH